MRYKAGLVIALLAAVNCLAIPSPGQGQIRNERDGLSGVFLDSVHKRPVWYEASTENGMLTLHLGLSAQSVTLRLGQGEFYLSSSNNSDGRFSTLSDDDREALRQLAVYLDQEIETQNSLDSSAICAIRNLSSWPADLPLSVSVDSTTKTVGEISIPMEEIQEAHRSAMNDLNLEFPGAEMGAAARKWVSLCASIGRTHTACYPTSLIPYREKCEAVLVGGTTCRGRCGTLCNGLCSGQRYTQDCHNHDRCADVNGISHQYCSFIFSSAFDDCTDAKSCTDLPGSWDLKFTWNGASSSTVVFNVFPNKSATSSDGGVGTWSVVNSKVTVTSPGGCKPIYTGTLSTNRQTVSGKMKCRIQGGDSGTWSASKTDRILPARTREQAGDLHAEPESRGSLSNPPD
jgi:hypothetical protein